MKRVIILVIAMFVISVSQAQKWETYITVKIKGLPNARLILGHHKDKNLIPDDTVMTNSEGVAVFKRKKKYTDGLYLIYLPNRTYFDFIMGDDQHFTIETDTADLYKDLKIEGSPDNEVFLEYQKFVESRGKRVAELQKKLKQAKTKSEKDKYRKKLEKLDEQWQSYIDKLVSEHPNLFVSKFLKAMEQVKVPDTLKDPLKAYLWMKKHYFDNFDISSLSMLYTPFYSQRVDYYLDHVIIQDPDSLNKAVDYLLSKAKGNKELYKFMLIHLFNKYARSQLMIAENVYVHLAEIYIKDAYWSKKDFIKRLKTSIARKKNCLIGEKAKDFEISVLPGDSASIEQLRVPLQVMRKKGLELEKKYPKFDDRVPYLSTLIADYMGYFPNTVDLYSVNANYIVLWFWDPECSHCQRQTPRMFKIFKDELKSKGVVVFAVYLPRNTDNWARFCAHIGKWFSFVEKHHMYDQDWINGWNPFANVRFKYDINATPKVYVLDKNKKIIAKNLGPEQVKEVILDMEKMKNKKQKK